MESNNLSIIKLRQLLVKLEASPEDYITLYVRPSSLDCFMNELSLTSNHSVYTDEMKQAIFTKDIILKAEKYNTGAAIYWSVKGNKYLVLPPFPVTEDKILTGGIDTSVLKAVIEGEYVIGVILVTWGTYSIGIFDNGNLVDSKTGTGHIHKEHKKGGSSAKRFARRTEEQKKDFLRKVGNRIEERFKNYQLDYVFFGGNRLILKPLLKECKSLEIETLKISGRIINVRHANKDALMNSLEEITKSMVFVFQDHVERKPFSS